MQSDEIQYSIINNHGVEVLTALVDGELKTVTSENPNFDAIFTGVRANDKGVLYLFDLTVAVEKKFTRLSERLSVNHGRVYFDGDEVAGVLEDQIVRFLDKDDAQAQSLIKFYEKLAQNPSQESRENLYRWLEANGRFAITRDGDFVAYKGVASDGNGGFTSINQGFAIVDGVEVNGQVKYSIGSVVEMPRSQVTWDSSVGCAQGLHAGTWNYASNFSREAVLVVVINPRDVVSVPTECSDQKLRVSRFQVSEVIEKELDEDVYEDYDSDYEDESDDWEDDDEEDFDGWWNS